MSALFVRPWRNRASICSCLAPSKLAIILSLVLPLACDTQDKYGQGSDLGGALDQLPEPNHTQNDVVAEVNGKPVLASCLLAQMKEAGIGGEEALKQCVDFELLAQKAESTEDKESAEEASQVQKRESVRTLLRKGYYANRKGPGALPQAYIDRLWDRAIVVGGRRFFLKSLFDRPELRGYSTCVFPFPPVSKAMEKAERQALTNAGRPVPTESEEIKRVEESKQRRVHFVDAQKAAAYLTYIALLAQSKGESLTETDFSEICRNTTAGMVASGAVPSLGNDRPLPKGARPGHFEKAVAEFSKAGEFTEPVETPVGWFIIFLRTIMKEEHLSREEAEPRIRDLVWNGHPAFDGTPPLQKIAADREKFFAGWLDQFSKKYEVSMYPERIPAPATTGWAAPLRVDGVDGDKSRPKTKPPADNQAQPTGARPPENG